MSAAGESMIELCRDLCRYRTGVVADENETLFARLAAELPFQVLRYPSGQTHNGWLVPQNWRVKKAEIRRDGRVLFDGTRQTLAVGRYSRSFEGRLSWEQLKPRLVTNSELPDAYVFHCMWQYRPWAAEWAISVPFSVYRHLGPGEYDVELLTEYEDGEMLVGTYDKKGRGEDIVIFHSNNCHPHMANDGFAGTAVLIRLFQWLAERDTHYTYRLFIGPEHVGTIFYLRELPASERKRIVSAVFEEMPGTGGPITVASTFLGDQPLDLAFRNSVRHCARAHRFVPWRQGAGNDETVWEAPGYEIPCVEVTRSEELLRPYREYHTSLDNTDLMNPLQLEEMLRVLQQVVLALEGNARPQRTFDGLICLSNPQYDLYAERADPAVSKSLPEDAERWGYLVDCLLRYLDGSVTLLEIAERHALPFSRLRQYMDRFVEKGLVRLDFEPLPRPVDRIATAPKSPRR